MRLAVIGDPNRKTKDRSLIREGEKYFDESIYIPITQLRFDLTKKMGLRFNGERLEKYDTVLPIPTIRYKELFYAALRMLDNSSIPFTADSYLFTSDDIVFFDMLNRNKIKTREILLVASNISLPVVLEKIKFPVIVRHGTKRVIVTNPRTLKDVVSLSSVGVPVKIEKPLKPKKMVWVFVVGNEVVCYEKSKKKSKPYKPDKRLKKLARKIRSLVGCDYCAMRFLLKDGWSMDQFTFSPNFQNFEKATGVNVSSILINHMREKVRSYEKTWWVKKFEELVRR